LKLIFSFRYVPRHEHARNGLKLAVSRLKFTFQIQRGDAPIGRGSPVPLSQVCIHGFPRFAPALESQTADETEAPLLDLTNGLQLRGGINDFGHGELLS
jgi:hypothetical protein